MSVGANSTYWGDVRESLKSLSHGLGLTIRHFMQAIFKKHRPPIATSDNHYFKYDSGIFTTQYPREVLPVPDNGRYRLHNEIEDCIVCDKCAKICPVNCIDIEPVRSTEEIRKASDGSSIRLYAATFDIDMAKCCYCGLCTTVCPTECLTMTKTYDYSEYDIRNMVYAFSDLTEEEAKEKKAEFEKAQAEKAKAREGAKSGDGSTASTKPAGMPKIKPAIKKKPDEGQNREGGDNA